MFVTDIDVLCIYWSMETSCCFCCLSSQNIRKLPEEARDVEQTVLDLDCSVVNGGEMSKDEGYLI